MPLRPPYAPVRPPRRRQGFALIITIILMSMLVLIMVSFSALTRVEIALAKNYQKLDSARANALMGLQIALGQLQAEAGADQRVTARAEILDDPNSTVLRKVSGSMEQPLWTGVWKTGNTGLDAVASGNSQRTTSFTPAGSATPDKEKSAKWLVSNPTPATPLNPTTWTGTTSGPTPDAVTLAKNLGPNAISVTVPLVPLKATPAGFNSAQTIGGYAYWVGDEGVKAKVNLIDPTHGVTLATSFVQNQLHFLAPQAVPINTQSANPAHTGLLGAANTTDVRDQASLSKVIGLTQMTFVPGVSLTPAALLTHSPDVTTYSHGVIANVRTGGLKTDLSTTFEDATLYKAFLTAKQLATDSPGDAKVFTGLNGTVIYGPRWQGLYNYYSLYKTTIPANGENATLSPFLGFNSFSGGVPGTTTPQMNMQAYHYASKPTAAGVAGSCAGEYYMPRLLAAGVYLSLSSEIITTTPTGLPAPAAGQHYYSFRLFAEPRIAYYNPYNVTLKCPIKTVTKSLFSLGWGGNIFGKSWTLKAGTTTIINNINMLWTGGITYPLPPNPQTPTYTAGVLSFSTDPTIANLDLTFKPGEVRVFGLKNVTAGNQLTYGSTTSYLVGTVGQTQWSYVPDGTKALTGAAETRAAWVGLLNDTDVVSISTPAGNTMSTNGRVNAGAGIDCPPNALCWPAPGPLNSTVLYLGRCFMLTGNEAATTMQVGQVGNIVGDTQGTPFGHFVLRARGINQSQTSSSGAATAMPVFASCDGNISPIPLITNTPSQVVDYVIGTQNPSSSTEMQVSGSSSFCTSFYGNKDAGRDSSDSAGFVMADIPRQPLVSLGQFMHMMMRNSMNAANGGPEVSSALMPVGGSLCNPFLKLDSTSGSSTGYGTPPTFVLDDNYLMNDGLFDDYFLSTVPAASPDVSYKAIFPTLTGTGSTAAEFNDTNIQAHTVTLPNARMTFYAKNGTPPQASDTTKTNYLPNTQKCAANLLLDGAFNVNSTSVAAWAALLSSPSGNALNYLYNGSFQAAGLNGRVPILRFPSVVSADGTDPVNTAFGGVHALTQDQITELATEIVKQVKARGPFLSMADFINRRLDLTTGYGFKGALQAAIDATTINATNLGAIGMTSSSGVTGVALGGPLAGGAFYPNQIPTNTAIGVPGWLMQQDLVQAFSPNMTVRSDTFVIRTYGEVVNPATSTAEAKAWCEAVVQRVPDYVDPTDPKLTGTTVYGTNLGDATPPYDYKTDPNAPTAIVNTINQTFGRRFKVISFRWIKNETDI